MEYPIDKREYMLSRLAYCRAHPINGLYPKLVVVQPHDRRMFLVNPNYPTYRKHRPGSNHPRCIDVSPHYAIRWCKNPPDYDAPIADLPDPLHPHVEGFSQEMEDDSQVVTLPQSPSHLLTSENRENAPSDDFTALQHVDTSSPPRTMEEFDAAISNAIDIVNHLRSERGDDDEPPTINTEGHEPPAASGPPVTNNIPAVLPDKDAPPDSPLIKLPSLDIRPALPSETPFNFEKEMQRIRPQNLVLKPPPFLSTALEFVDNLPLFPHYFYLSMSLENIFSYVTLFTSEYDKFREKLSDLKKRSDYPDDWDFYTRCARAYSLLSRCYLYFFAKHAISPDQKNLDSLTHRFRYTSVRQSIFDKQYGEARNAHYAELYDTLVKLVDKYGLN